MSETCSNPGYDNKFTCPACYHDFNGRQNKCPGCGADVVCVVEQQPVCVCTLGVADPEED